MHIYNRKSKKLKTFAEIKDLVDFYLEQGVADRQDLYFWNFGCPGWRLAKDILTVEILKEKSADIPEFPPSAEDQPVVRLDPVADGFKLIDIVPEKPKSPPPPAVAETPRSAEPTDIQKTQATPPLPKPADFSDQRRFKRYDTRLKVIVSNKQKTFLSYSKNVSEGGIMLEDRIPNYMFNEDSEIFISAPNKKEIIAFRCQPIGDENPNRLRFQQSETDYIEKLKEWLENSSK